MAKIVSRAQVGTYGHMASYVTGTQAHSLAYAGESTNNSPYGKRIQRYRQGAVEMRALIQEAARYSCQRGRIALLVALTDLNR